MAILAVDNPTRRGFLRSMPVAAAAGLTFGDLLANAQSTPRAVAQSSFQLFTAETIQADINVLEASPATDNLVTSKNFTVGLTVESASSAKEFEWHEGRDHILQILSGSTVMTVGGTPGNAHCIGPGEWRAPTSEGSTAITLNKGDMLVVPRNTPHKRSTSGTVTLILISPQGTAA